METIIDGAILLDFFKSQPKQIPFGTEEDNLIWNSFWSYIKSKTDLDVRNYKPDDIFHEAFLNISLLVVEIARLLLVMNLLYIKGSCVG